jgi:hypothetical protein
MSLFTKLFNFVPKPTGDYGGFFKMLDGYTPHFTTYQGGLYEMQLIRAAINARAVHAGKLKVEINGTAKPALRNKLKHAPNSFQTWTQFLYRLSTILDVNNTAFVVPIYDEFGEVSGIYAPLPQRCEFVQYGDTPYLRYTFSNGDKAAIELENCGIMTKFQYKHDLVGDDNTALSPTMELINIQNQGIQEGVKSAATYRFWAKVNNFTKVGDLAKERQRFSEENFSKDANGGGLLLFPNTYSDINQITAKPWVIDSEQMKYIRDGVFEYFMVNEDILTNKAYGDAWVAFYEGAVEPFAVQFSEVITKMLFTFNEQNRENLVMATANRLQYMSNKEKLEVSAQLADRGILNRDEVREIWNLPPLPNGEGQEYIIRGEYWNATEKISEGGSDDEVNNNE